MVKLPSRAFALLSVVGLTALLACGDPPAGPLTATPQDLAFGEVLVGGSTSRAVTLTNTSTSAITVTEVSASSDALITSGQALPLTLSPGESTSLNVEVAPSVSGDVTGTVTVTSDTSNDPSVVRQIAKAVRPQTPLDAAPSAVSFGEVLVGDRAAAPVTLTNSSDRDVTITALTVAGDGVAATIPELPLTVAAGASVDLSTEFAPTAPGKLTGLVTVRTDRPHPLAIVELSGTGIVPGAPLSVTPTAVSFGDVTVGGFIARVVTLTNVSAEPIAISELTATGAGFSASGPALPATLAPGSSATVTVKFTPTTSGPSTGTLLVGSGTQPNALAMVGYSGNGVAFAQITNVTVRDASVTANGSVQMTADVVATGTIDKSLTWSLEPGSTGSIDSKMGLYTAGATAGTVRVWATSNADPTKKGSGVVTVSAAPVANPPPVTAPPVVTEPAPAPTGPQFYVATTGNDANPGTEAAPWRTIQKAMSAATPGSTVNVRGGTYGEKLVMNVQGAPGNYITFQPYGFSVPAGGCGGHTGVACGGEKVFLDYTYLGVNVDAVPALNVSSKSYLRIQGLTFQNFTGTGSMQQIVRIDGNSSYIDFQYNTIKNSGTNMTWGQITAFMPFRVWGNTGTTSHINIVNNEFANLVDVHGEALVVAYPGAHEILVEGNYLHDIDTIGIDIAYGAYNFTVRRNKLEYVGKKRDGSYWYGQGHINVYVDGGHTGVVEANQVDQCGGAYQAMSELPATYQTHDVIIRNNVARRCSFGMVIGTYYGDGSSVYNNTYTNNVLYGNSEGIIIKPMVASTMTWKNNISANNTGSNYYNDGGYPVGDSRYNLYFGGNAGPEAVKLVADPLFVDPASGNFSLRAGSPAINAGDPASGAESGWTDFAGTTRILGGRVDIGANEAQ